MTAQDILQRLRSVRGGRDQWTAQCPAHDDARNSLSVSEGQDGRILLKCHAGCSVEDIAGALGLSVKDLFAEGSNGAIGWNDTIAAKSPGRRSPPVVATYTYPNGAQKLRRADKSFVWRRPDGKGGWIWSRKGLSHTLYIAGDLAGGVFICEGEKDADNLHKLGYNAVSGEDGAGPGKWHKEYTEQLEGRTVCIFQDNDDVGRAYAQETAAALYGVASSIQVLDISTVWPEIPEHGDVSDLIERAGTKACELIATLIGAAPQWTPDTAPVEVDSILSAFKSLESFEEEEARWLIPGWIPEGQITLMAADGGVGKTTIWCDVIAALSNGTSCLLDPPGHTRLPVKVTFLTTEDSIKKKLRKRLRLAGANMANIITPDFTGNNDLLHKLKFGSPEMEKVIRHFRPVFCVFDSVQGFVPPRVNMGSRNEMRDCISPLIALGEDVGTTSMIICHTNKRKGASGRDRIADSADLWDIARSVIMAGFTEEHGVRYLSNEKNNYAPLQQTILFTIDNDGRPHKAGTSWKRDREYMLDADLSRSAPKLADCKGFILKALDDAGGAMPVKELEDAAKQAGYAFKTIRNAKDALKQEGTVKYFQTGTPKDKVWHIQRIVPGQFAEVDGDDLDNPFETDSPSKTPKRSSEAETL